jgi:hypothetical protein
MPSDTKELFALGFEDRRVVEERQVLVTANMNCDQRELQTYKGRILTYRGQLVSDIAAEASIVVVIATRK